MLKIAMSRAASGLLRALIGRGGTRGNRILLSEIQSIDWQSLTLTGERHVIRMRVPGPDAETLVGTVIEGIEDAEFSIPGQIVADIAVAGVPTRADDGSITLTIEALTVLE